MPNRRTLHSHFAFFLLLAYLTACGSRATVLPSPIPSPTITPIPTQAAVTRSEVTATSLPHKPTPTATIKPSRTPTPQPSPTEHKNPDTPLSDKDRYEQLETQVATFPKTCENTYSNKNSISPDNKWLASSCGYGHKQDALLEIVNRNGIKYTLFFKDYAENYFIDGNPPMGGLYPVQYLDEDNLYFYAVVGFSGGGTCYYGVGVHGVYQMDLNTGVVSEILPQTSSLDGYLIAFSPDGKMLAYNHGGLPDPVLVNLSTEEQIQLVDGDAESGNFTWSPDGANLAYATCQSTEDGTEIVKSTVQIYDLETREIKTILEVDENFLEIETWDEENILKVSEQDFDKRKPVYWYFDWDSGQVSQPTLKPKP